jgi:acetyltransferase
MTVRNLEFLFRPRAIAVIGASDRPNSVGAAVTRNVLEGGFKGPIALVNPSHTTIAGHRAFPTVASLEIVPDLAVICTPPQSIPELIAHLGERGTRAAIVLTAGLDQQSGNGTTLTHAMLEAARPHLLRILGPNCVGMLAPHVGLNASFSHAPAREGHLAFVSQSGALTTALLDWARSRDIGFSHFVSLGEASDVDFGDTLNYLAADQHTRAILLYIESIKSARKFMSAARAASRSKPIIVVKAGRAPEGAKAAASHTGALAGADDVYDAALRRAGAIRVDSMLDLFVAAETLSRAKRLNGDRLAILTNGGGLAVLAADALSLGGGQMSVLGPETMERLNAVLPRTWSHGNPIDIIGDAPAARYVDALTPVLADPGTDAVLFLHAPTAIVDSSAIADAVAPILARAGKPSFTCWLGGEAVAKARETCLAEGLPTYETPEAAVTGFLQVVEHRHNRQALMQMPPSLPEGLLREPEQAQAAVDAALAAGTTILSEADSKAILKKYGIPTVETRIARDAAEAVRVADAIGYPVALKILSPDISHKSDSGGVALDLRTGPMVAEAAKSMLQRVAAARPDARLEGFAVQQMIVADESYELIVGASTDAVFGPVILFGAGGKAVETVRDRAVALPPLNVALARELIGRTRISKMLAGFRDVPPVDMEAIERTLLAVAQLVADVPDIAELDINPLLVSAKGVIALDARISVARSAVRGTERFAIRPYPVELESHVRIQGGQEVFVRPVRPEDESKYPGFLERTTETDLYFRFFQVTRKLAHDDLARFTQIDYDREMAFIALAGDEIVGVVRSISDPDNVHAEFAILIRSDWGARGLGYALMQRIIAYSRERGTQELFGEVISHNHRMLELAQVLGFRPKLIDGQTTRVALRLAETSEAPVVPSTTLTLAD